MLHAGHIVAGDFEILEPLSQGGMGQVYRVRQQSTGAERALKVMLPRWQEREDFRVRFEREAKVNALIESEHVVKVLAYGVEPESDLPWLVMEYLRGRTLEEHALKSATNAGIFAQKGELLRQLFHGVTAAHREQIVHRDLKPSNVFVAHSGRADVPFTVKVLDFGIAKRLGAGNAVTEPLGTRAWAAPEQDEDGAGITTSTDVWALGLLVFWFLTGRSYWRHSEGASADLAYETHFAELELASVRAREEGFGALSAGFDAWFGACVARDPGLRYPDAATAWEGLLPELSAMGLLSAEASLLAQPTKRFVPAVTAAGHDSSSHERPLQPVPRAHGMRTTRLYNVPLPAASFVGRSAELRRLRAEVLRDQPSNAVSVEGLPGIGKTELLLKLAHEFAREGRFPGGIFWLSAESPDLTAGWASEAVAGALGVSGGSLDERAQRVVNTLSDSQSPTLIVLDNVEHWSESRKPEPLPLGVRITLLVSSRVRRLGGTRFRALTLGMLRDSEARKLLIQTAGSRAASAPGFETLLNALEGYTLAIELAGTYLMEFPEVSPASYLEAMHSGREFTSSAAELTRYERTVNQAFALLWERFGERTRERWLLAAQFAPERVSAAIADAAGLDGDARSELRRHHLIDRDEGGAFRMHRLTRSFPATVADDDARQRARDTFLGAITEQAKRIELATGFRVYAPDRAHFDAAVELARQNTHAPSSADLFAGIATALHSIGELVRARELFEVAIESDLPNFGEDSERVATLRSNLALVLQDLGEHAQARALLERALAADLAQRADNVYKILLRRSSLAMLLQASGQVEAARDLLDQALESALPALGEEHVMIAIARSNLCSVLTDLGELDRAEAVVRLALASDIQRLGEGHPHVGIRRARLAAVFEARGERAHAIALLRQVLDAEPSGHGLTHPRMALVQARLAALLDQTGDHEGAVRHARDALSRVQTHPPSSVYRKGVEALASKVV
jgi:serine/threonine protein kinase/tetratricopeptide (TPR) repeat protein